MLPWAEHDHAVHMDKASILYFFDAPGSTKQLIELVTSRPVIRVTSGSLLVDLEDATSNSNISHINSCSQFCFQNLLVKYAMFSPCEDGSFYVFTDTVLRKELIAK